MCLSPLNIFLQTMQIIFARIFSFCSLHLPYLKALEQFSDNRDACPPLAECCMCRICLPYQTHPEALRKWGLPICRFLYCFDFYRHNFCSRLSAFLFSFLSPIIFSAKNTDLFFNTEKNRIFQTLFPSYSGKLSLKASAALFHVS